MISFRDIFVFVHQLTNIYIYIYIYVGAKNPKAQKGIGLGSRSTTIYL